MANNTHAACIDNTRRAADRVAERTIALRNVVDWWDGLPPTLRQDIEGSGFEPGCIAAARRLSTS